MVRRLAAAVAFVVLATACGDAKPPTPGTSVGTTRDDSTVSTTTEDDEETNTTRRPGAGAGPGPPGATAATNGPRPTSGRPNTSSKPLIDDAADRSVGGFAGVLLAPGVADRLILDVRVGEGANPSAEALNAAADALRTASGKPVEINGPTRLNNAGPGVFTANEIRALATNQGTPNRDGVAVVHIVYLGGRFENEGSLGVAVRGDTVAIFPDAVDSAASPFASRNRIERAVAVHEIGHVTGLVDLYLDRNREDPENPGHSSNRGSVMYWAVETSLVGQVLGGPPPVDFDAEDVADFKQIRAGAARA